MKKFVFKFETVEKVRKEETQRSLRVLAEAQKELSRLLLYRQFLADQTDLARQRLENNANDTGPISSYQIEDQFIEGQKYRIKEIDKTIRQQQERVQQAMQEYLEKNKKQKIIEKLREKDFLKYKEEVKKDEAKKLDEIYVSTPRKRAV